MAAIEHFQVQLILKFASPSSTESIQIHLEASAASLRKFYSNSLSAGINNIIKILQPNITGNAPDLIFIEFPGKRNVRATTAAWYFLEHSEHPDANFTTLSETSHLSSSF